MSSARDVLATALIVLALLLGALWLPAAWFESHVVDRDGFLAISQPLAEDPEVRSTVADGAVDEILGGDRIPDPVTEQVTPLAQEQAETITGTEAYATMWEATMVELHGALFEPGASDLEVDLGPAIDGILGAIEERLPVTVPRPEDPTITVATIPDVPLLTHATILDPWAHRLGPAALGLAVLALLVAAHRRTLLALTGVAGMIAGGAALLLTANIETLVPDTVDQATFLGPIVQAFEESFTAEVAPQSIILLGAGALVTAAGLVLVGLHRRS